MRINVNDLPEKLQAQVVRKIGKSYNKYSAQKTTIDGITFDSKKEAERYAELCLWERSGIISDLVLQPEFVLQPGFVYHGKKERAIKYIADFQYMQDGKTIVEDVKGKKTDVYKLKRKMFLALYGEKYDFQEV